jgi:uncharacterized membrane protein YfcA
MASQVVGNLMGAFVINKVKESTFYMILTGFALLAALLFLFLPKPIP